MQIMTSSWFSYFGPGRIGISRGVPRGKSISGYKRYVDLAPSREGMRIGNEARYRARFEKEILGELDPKKVLEDLKAKWPESDRLVLLCFEKPPFHATNFCHRRMVADWLKRELGLDVPEWSKEMERV